MGAVNVEARAFVATGMTWFKRYRGSRRRCEAVGKGGALGCNFSIWRVRFERFAKAFEQYAQACGRSLSCTASQCEVRSKRFPKDFSHLGH